MTTDTIRSADILPGVTVELSLRGLRVFVAVEETGSVGGAAKRIGGSPSGVSQQITALEEAVGAKLFDRRARPVTLTPAGQVLRAHAHRILEAVSDAQAELAELNLAVLPQLSLGIIDDLDASFTPALVSSLQERFRNCFVNTSSGRSDVITAQLERREADIVVSGIVPDDANSFRSIQILREPFVLVDAKGVVDPDGNIREQVADLPFVRYSDAMPIGRAVAQHLRRVRFNVPRRFAFESSRSVFAMVAKAGGWTLATPLNLMDAERFVPELEIFGMPFPALSRRIWLIARAEELGRLPDRMALECRDLVAEQISPRFNEIVPALAGAIEVMNG